MDRDWAHLPVDLLIDIAKRSKCVEDMSAFSSVCSSWKSVSRTAKRNWTPAIPCLMLPNTGDSPERYPSCNWIVYDHTTNKRCNVELPETLSWHYQDCGDGWIFAISPFHDIQLFNPLTKAQICLPSEHTLPDAPGHMIDRDKKDWVRDGHIRSVILVKIPPNNDLLVFAVCDLSSLAFAKPGDSEWSCIDCVCNDHTGNRNPVEDVMIFDDQIVILYGDGKLEGCSVDLFLTNPKAIAVDVYVRGDIDGDISIYADSSLEKLYLVESFGDILVVLRHTKTYVNKEDLEEEDFPLVIYHSDLEEEEEEEEDRPTVVFSDLEEEKERREFRGVTDFSFATLWFEVFKLDESGEWVGVDDLGDVSLFVGNNSSVAVCASDAKSKPNCIYFTDDKPYPTYLEWRGVGIFDLRSGVIEELWHGSYVMCTQRAPFWFMPKFM